MKTTYKLLFLLVLIPKLIWAYDEKKAFNKEKSLSKTYEVNADALLNVTNKYGAINVYLWDENKISIQVNITVSGNKEDKVNELLKAIDVSFQGNSSKVSATTELNTKNGSGNNISYEINYVVKIPRNGSIDLVNKYGNIAIDKLNGSSIIECKYGSLTLGQFTNKSNTITLAYSPSTTINSIDKLSLKSQYSTVEIGKANQLSINGNYNTFIFQSIENLNIASNYTKIKATSLTKSTINGNYLTVKLGEIKNATAINSNYSDIYLDANSKTNSILIDGNYSHSKITCASDFAFDFAIAMNYGSFKDNLGVKYTDRTEKSTSKSYSGYHLSQGKSKINITTNYGSVQLLTK